MKIMNLIQKAIKKAKDFIDEKVMSRKFDLYIKIKKDRNGTGYNRSRREY